MYQIFSNQSVWRWDINDNLASVNTSFLGVFVMYWKRFYFHFKELYYIGLVEYIIKIIPYLDFNIVENILEKEMMARWIAKIGKEMSRKI